jgi:plasmid stabilization system protein ParE
MRRPVIVSPDAEADLDEAVAWYDGQRKGLGKQFARAVRATLAQVAKAPEAHAKVYGDARRARVTGFQSYVAFYVVGPAQVDVIAVFHTSRNPRIWQSRVDDLDTP